MAPDGARRPARAPLPWSVKSNRCRNRTKESWRSAFGRWKPRTRKICDIRILILWTKICPNLMILVFLDSWDQDLSKFGKTKLVKDPKFGFLLGLREPPQFKRWRHCQVGGGGGGGVRRIRFWAPCRHCVEYFSLAQFSVTYGVRRR